MKKFSNFTLFFVATISFFGCQEDIDLEIDNQSNPIVVVQAMLNNKPEPQLIRITESTSYYNNLGAKPATNAIVSVTANDGSGTFIFNPLAVSDSLGFYISPPNFSITQGVEYFLNINYNNQLYTASSLAKPVPEIDSLRIYQNQIQFLFVSDFAPIGPEDTLYDIEVNFKELPANGDFYLFNLYVNGVLFSDQPREKFVLNDEALNDYVRAAFFSTAKNTDIFPGDTVGVEVLSVSKDVEDFYNILFLQTDISGNPFGGSPPANVPTNIEGGAKGIFQVSLAKKNEIIFMP